MHDVKEFQNFIAESILVCPSTLKDLKEELQQHPPKQAVFIVEQRRGGFLNVSCVEELPRNSLQASRIKCKNTPMLESKPGDPLQALVVKFKEQYGNPNQFIQSIRLVHSIYPACMHAACI